MEFPVRFSIRRINDITRGTLLIIQEWSEASHNHATQAELSQFYVEHHQPTKVEKERIKEMARSGQSSNLIAETLSAIRDSAGSKVPVLPKDVRNVITAIGLVRRKDRTEEDVLDEVLESIRNNDPYAVIVKVVDDGADEFLRSMYIQVSAMRELFSRYPETIFIDGTYRINIERYNLWCVLVEDCNGFGRCVALGFLANEEAVTKEKFFTLFKENNDCSQLKAIFVDKDLKNLEILDEVFYPARVLLCSFHTVRAMRIRVRKEDLTSVEKQSLLNRFRMAMYAADEDMYLEKVETLLQSVSEDFVAYFQENWANCVERWAMYQRRNLRTLRNDTNNRIKRFFALLKSALREAGRRTPKRIHLTECVEITLSVITKKTEMSKFVDFIDRTKYLVKHDFPLVYAQYGREIEKVLTNFAAKLLKVQFELNLQRTYTIDNMESGAADVIHDISGRHYEVTTDQLGRHTCSCFFSCSFGLPCRHIIVVRQCDETVLFDVEDCIPRWRRGSPESASDQIDMFEGVLEGALQGTFEETEADLQGPWDDQSLRSLARTETRYTKAMDTFQRCSSVLATLQPDMFWCLLTQFEAAILHIERGKMIRIVCEDNMLDQDSQTEIQTEILVSTIQHCHNDNLSIPSETATGKDK